MTSLERAAIAVILASGAIAACNGVTLIDSDAAGAAGATNVGGSSDAGAAGATTAGATSVGGSANACANPTPIAGTSLVRCADGSIDRVADAPVTPPPATTGCSSAGMHVGPPDACATDADCGGVTNGRCELFSNPNGGPTAPEVACVCIAYCTSDADCTGGDACIPVDPSVSGGPSKCSYALCTKSADCPTGECGFSLVEKTGSNSGFCSPKPALVCRTASDACREDAACTDGSATFCAPSEPGAAWACYAPLACP